MAFDTKPRGIQTTNVKSAARFRIEPNSHHLCLTFLFYKEARHQTSPSQHRRNRFLCYGPQALKKSNKTNKCALFYKINKFHVTGPLHGSLINHSCVCNARFQIHPDRSILLRYSSSQLQTNNWTKLHFETLIHFHVEFAGNLALS